MWLRIKYHHCFDVRIDKDFSKEDARKIVREQANKNRRVVNFDFFTTSLYSEVYFCTESYYSVEKFKGLSISKVLRYCRKFLDDKHNLGENIDFLLLQEDCKLVTNLPPNVEALQLPALVIK